MTHCGFKWVNQHESSILGCWASNAIIDTIHQMKPWVMSPVPVPLWIQLLLFGVGPWQLRFVQKSGQQLLVVDWLNGGGTPIDFQSLSCVRLGSRLSRTGEPRFAKTTTTPTTTRTTATEERETPQLDLTMRWIWTANIRLWLFTINFHLCPPPQGVRGCECCGPRSSISRRLRSDPFTSLNTFHCPRCSGRW